MINTEEHVKYRLECLKLAYDLNFKIGNLKSSYESYETGNPEINKGLQDVFNLADVHFQYILDGTIILDLDEDN